MQQLFVLLYMPRTGRPKIDAKDRKGGVFTFRLNDAERQEIEEAASKEGKRATTWAREILLAKAREPR